MSAVSLAIAPQFPDLRQPLIDATAHLSHYQNTRWRDPENLDSLYQAIAIGKQKPDTIELGWLIESIALLNGPLKGFSSDRDHPLDLQGIIPKDILTHQNDLREWCYLKASEKIFELRRHSNFFRHSHHALTVIERQNCGNHLDIAFDLVFEFPKIRFSQIMSDSAALKYIPSNLADVLPVIRFLQLTSADVFYDVGCGFGRVNDMVARSSRARSVGIEYCDSVYDVAQRLCHKKNLPNLEIIKADAREYVFHDATVLFLYSPFFCYGSPNLIFKNFITKVLQDRKDRPSPLRVCTIAMDGTILEKLGGRKIFGDDELSPNIHQFDL